ncbi:MAG: DNA translocase FtsK [Bacteroidales bacterium]|nr:DNA translocase FtsK [Bacteroidales bacterium]
MASDSNRPNVKEKNNATKEGQDNGKNKLLRDERVRFTIGLFLLLLGVYFLISLISYLFTWKVDQSLEWQSLFSKAEYEVKNWTGRFGAVISAQFMNHWFGLSSLALPSIIIVFGLKLLKLYRKNIWRFIFNIFIGTLLCSLVLGFLFETAKGFLGSGLGGAQGLFVSKWLSALLGKVGTSFLLLLLVIAYTIFIKPSTLHWFRRTIRGLLIRMRRPVSRKNDKRQNKKEKTAEELAGQVDSEVLPNNTDAAVEVSLEKFIPEPNSELVDAEPFELIEEETAGTNSSNAENTPEKSDVEFTIEKINEVELNPVEVNGQELYDPTLELSRYQRPLLELLEDYKNTTSPVSNETLIENKNRIVETLSHYKIQIDKIKATIGPTVTLYEIVPAPGIRISKIKSLEDDIALSLAALGIRIIAPIPGKGTIGIEVPNQNPEIVSMHSIIKSQKFQECKYELAIALGKTISNEIFMLDLAKLPHLLVAGATGQGKSVGLNAIITSLLYKKHPAEIKFVLVDPKKVELTLYSKLERHFLAELPGSEEPIITDTQKVISTLNSLCIEMDNRYELLKLAQVRNIKEYNEKFVERRLNPNKGHRFLPYIILIIDEFADLIMTAGREVETPLARLAQLARAIGIHLIIATQRPSTNIITGVIKANFPARIAFRVPSMIDSRTILDHPGANNLVGRGDMLVSAGSDMVRVQCAFIDIPEIERITDFIGNQQGYPEAYQLPDYTPEGQDGFREIDLNKRDELFEEAARMVVQTQIGSTSLIQRKLSIGYNRAGRIVDQLEAAGIVGPFEGSKARQVLIADELSLEQILRGLSNQ